LQPRLKTPRLSLDPLNATDLDRLQRLLAEPGVRCYLCDDAILPREVVEDLIHKSLELSSSGLGFWGIEAHDAWIGCVGLQPVSGAAAAARPDFTGEVEPIIALRESDWHQGYASEALGAVLSHAFGTLRLTRLVALVDEPNAASHALMARTGFTAIGTTQETRFPLRAYERWR
jgi:ribosomal-protein-alanine N-acetyltransferase